MNISNFLSELKRRNVIRVATAYAIAGWLIIQVIDTIGPQLGFPEWIPPLFTILVLCGFPITLIIAWAFELTPDGLKTTKEVDADASISHNTGKKLNGIIIGVLSLLIAFLLFERFVIAPSGFAEDSLTSAINEKQITTASVAVLPFVDLSPDGDQEYFSDGISEEILNVLVKVEDIEVASRTSSFQFKGRDLGIPEIAKELKVKHVLEGSVRKSGDKIRITAQLIEAQTDKHLWSETYDRPLTTDNIFDIQDEISKAIVDELGILIGSASKITTPTVVKTTDNLGAYELYLKARTNYLSRSRMDEADDFLLRAIDLDPEYADAWEMRAAIQGLLHFYGNTDLDSETREEMSLEFAQKTLEINPQSSLAYATMGNIYMDRVSRMDPRHSIQDVFEQYDKALTLDPRNASAVLWSGIALAEVGYSEEAEKKFEFCLQLEPRYVPCFDNYKLLKSSNAKDSEALDIHYEGLNKGLLKVKYSNFAMLARLGEEHLFKAGTNSSGVLFGWNRHDELWKAFQNLDADHTELGRDIVNFVNGKSGIDKLSISMLVYPLAIFDFEKVTFMTWDPSFRKYRQSKEFKEYVKATGIYDLWQKNGFPDKCTPIGTNDFKCS